MAARRQASGSKMIKMLHVCLGVAILTAGLSHGSDNHDSQDCRGGSEAVVSAQATSSSRTSGGSDFSTASPSKAHSVRLSWNASVPASNSPSDAIRGYNIYRREPGKQYEKITLELIPGTNCLDHSVKAGRTYDYQAVAVSAQGKVSKPSNVTKATIPSQ
jgi:fibronectin type 3 domain-containing protein